MALLFAGTGLAADPGTMTSEQFQAAEAEMTGFWYAEATQAGNEEIHLDMTLKLNSDGTARIDYGEESYPATWALTPDGILLAEEGEAPSSLTYTEDGNLIMTDSAGMIVFSRIPPGAGRLIESGPPVKLDAKAKDFEGEWVGLFIAVMGTTVFLKDPGTELNLSIKGGRVSKVNGANVLAHVTTLVQAPFMLVPNPETSTTHVLSICQDGTLSAWIQGTEPLVYFVKKNKP